jgi:hypothetical protein
MRYIFTNPYDRRIRTVARSKVTVGRRAMARHPFLQAVLGGTSRYQPVPTADALIHAVLIGTALPAYGLRSTRSKYAGFYMQYRPVLATTDRYRFASLPLALHTLQIRRFLYAVPAGTGHY